MHSVSRVVRFDARTGKCSLRITAGPDALQRVELNAAEDPACPGSEDPPLLREALRQLAAYFAGALAEFDLPLAMNGTEFQKRVWRALLEIPYGETWSYSQLAGHIGNPAAVRAVGAANGQNPLAIIVPCHRVIGAHGNLVGYGGGLPLKQMLLDLEAEHAERFRQAAAR